MKIPVFKRLKLNGEKVRTKVGRRLAKKVGGRIQSGDGASGALPFAKDIENVSGPFRRTGDFEKSLKYNKRKHRVEPTGTRPDGRTNFQVLAANLGRPEMIAADPLGVDEALERESVKVAEKEIARQFSRNEGGLVAELRRIK